MALQLWYSFSLLNNILPFETVLDLFSPLHKLLLLHVIPDISSHPDLGLPTGFHVNDFHLYVLLTALCY